jgi:hypothetical protein
MATCICDRVFGNLGTFDNHLEKCVVYKAKGFSRDKNFNIVLSQRKKLSQQAITK